MNIFKFLLAILCQPPTLALPITEVKSRTKQTVPRYNRNKEVPRRSRLTTKRPETTEETMTVEPSTMEQLDSDYFGPQNDPSRLKSRRNNPSRLCFWPFSCKSQPKTFKRSIQPSYRRIVSRGLTPRQSRLTTKRPMTTKLHVTSESKCRKQEKNGQRCLKVHIQTCDKRYAGTDSKIKIQFSGSKDKRSELITLDSWGNDFERGNKDVFYIAGDDIGEINLVTLHNSGGNGWCVESVTIGNDFFNFNGQWIDDGEKMISRNQDLQKFLKATGKDITYRDY